MATQLQAFRDIIPEMASTPDGTVERYLDIAVAFLNLDLIDDSVQGLAIVYKAASLLYERNKMAATPGGSQAAEGTYISSKTEGDLKIDYKELSGSAAAATMGKTTNGYEVLLERLYPQYGYIMTRFGYMGRA